MKKKREITRRNAFIPIAVIMVCVVFLGSKTSIGATYYLTSSGSGSAQTASNWNTSAGGGGTAASNFTTGGDFFNIPVGINGVISGAWAIGNAIVPSNITITIAGQLTINNSMAITLTQKNSGTNAIYVTGTIIFSGTGASQILGNLNGGSAANNIFILNSGASLKTANANGITGTTSQSINRTFVTASALNTGANYEFNGADQTMTGIPATVNNLTLSGSGSKTWSSVSTVNGNFIMSGSASATSLLETVVGNVDLSGNASMIIGDVLTVLGNFNVGSGSNLTQNTINYLVIVSGNFSGGGTLTGVSSKYMEYDIAGNWTFTGTSAYQLSLILNGTGNQTLSGVISTSNYTLTIDKPSGEINLGTSLVVTGNLDITTGIINTTASNVLTFNDGATVSGGSSSAYINGPVKKIGNDDFTFPIGKGGKWARCGINNTSGTVTDAFTAEYFKNGYGDLSVSGITNVSGSEYWTITKNTGTSSPNVTLYYEDGAFSGITSSPTSSNLCVAHYNGTDWELASAGTKSVSGTTSSGSVSITGVTNFSPFSFGGNGSNPLPVSWLFTKADLLEKNIRISWATASETNNDRFEIERSTNGEDFIKIGEIKGNGNSNQILHYQYIDIDAANLKPSILYYRLKQIDFNGKSEYSITVKLAIVKINLASRPLIYPNPFTNELELSIPVIDNEIVRVNVLSMIGDKLIEVLSPIVSNGQVHLDTSLLPIGMYMMQINQNNVQTNYRIIKK